MQTAGHLVNLRTSPIACVRCDSFRQQQQQLQHPKGLFWRVSMHALRVTPVCGARRAQLCEHQILTPMKLTASFMTCMLLQHQLTTAPRLLHQELLHCSILYTMATTDGDDEQRFLCH
jgi:hypothetical protein